MSGIPHIPSRTGAGAPDPLLEEALRQIISHDLMNPLTAVLAAAEELQEAPGNRTLIDIIGRAGRRVRSIAERAWTLSRITGSAALSTHPVSLLELLLEVITRFQTRLIAAGMTVDLRVAEELRVQAHPVLADAFAELLDNAILHAASGGIVSIDAREEEEGMVTVRVRDAGAAIPESRLSSLFTPELRGTPDAHGGRGIGLAIVGRIAALHGGRVRYETAHPSGNRFCLALPGSRPVHPA